MQESAMKRENEAVTSIPALFFAGSEQKITSPKLPLQWRML
jgi:hypothetical protein